MPKQLFSQAALPWDKLPSYVRDDFRKAKYENWYKEASLHNNEKAALTLINAYLKLKNRDLWQFVDRPAQLPSETTSGSLEFITERPEVLKRTLFAREDFTNPTWSPLEWKANWESREKVLDNQLHLKNFGLSNRIQAHIDPAGFVWREPWSAGSHLSDRKGYLDVYRISQKLSSQGYRSWFDLDLSAKPPQNKEIVRPYTVKAGDRIWNLAPDFNYRDRRQFTQDVLKVNPGLDPRKLGIGQIINLPFKTQLGGGIQSGASAGSSAGVSVGIRPSLIDRRSAVKVTPQEIGIVRPYTVKAGDRIWNLAPDFNYRDRRQFTQDVLKANQGLDPRKLSIGQIINLPFKTQMGKTIHRLQTGAGVMSSMTPGTTYSDIDTRKTYRVDPFDRHIQTGLVQRFATQHSLSPTMQTFQDRYNPMGEAFRRLGG